MVVNILSVANLFCCCLKKNYICIPTLELKKGLIFGCSRRCGRFYRGHKRIWKNCWMRKRSSSTRSNSSTIGSFKRKEIARDSRKVVLHARGAAIRPLPSNPISQNSGCFLIIKVSLIFHSLRLM